MSPGCRSALNQLSAVTLLYSCPTAVSQMPLCSALYQLPHFSTLVQQLSPSCHSALNQLSAVTLLYSCPTAVSQLPLCSLPAVNCHISVLLSTALSQTALLLTSCQLSHFLHFCTLVLQLSLSCSSVFNQLTAFKLYSSTSPTAVPKLPLYS